MDALKARVTQGRLVVEEPVDFPEGTVLELAIVDPGDDLDDAERTALHAALAKSWESAKAGKGRPAEALLQRLRSRNEDARHRSTGSGSAGCSD